jgi:hypothetical protein
MAALTGPRRTSQRATNHEHNFGVKANVQIFAGALVILAGGFLRPAREGQGGDNAAKAADAATYRAIGIASDSALGNGVDGGVTLDVSSDGPFPFAIGGGGDAVTRSDVGKPVYVIDDQTIGKTNPNATRCVAGCLVDVADGVAWVEVSPVISAALTA